MIFLFKWTTFSCLSGSLFLENNLSHSLHPKSFIFKWILLICISNLLLETKVLSQSLQWRGVSLKTCVKCPPPPVEQRWKNWVSHSVIGLKSSQRELSLKNHAQGHFIELDPIKYQPRGWEKNFRKRKRKKSPLSFYAKVENVVWKK